jgi:hypothetical protein
VGALDFAREAIAVQRQLRKVAVALIVASVYALGYAVTAGMEVAGAATRSRSGSVRAQLLDSTSRVAPNSTAAPGLHLAGSGIVAAFVGLMAVAAMLFIIVTLVRRRSTIPA